MTTNKIEQILVLMTYCGYLDPSVRSTYQYINGKTVWCASLYNGPRFLGAFAGVISMDECLDLAIEELTSKKPSEVTHG